MGLRCLTSSSDGRVFAGFHSGHLKCYTGLGRLVWKKVAALPPLWSKCCVSLSDGQIVKVFSWLCTALNLGRLLWPHAFSASKTGYACHSLHSAKQRLQVLEILCACTGHGPLCEVLGIHEP